MGPFFLSKYVCACVHINYALRKREVKGGNNTYLLVKKMWSCLFCMLISASHVFYNECISEFKSQKKGKTKTMLWLRGCPASPPPKGDSAAVCSQHPTPTNSMFSRADTWTEEGMALSFSRNLIWNFRVVSYMEKYIWEIKAGRPFGVTFFSPLN